MSNRFKTEGCVAIVTGANRGIGLGFVEELLDQGAARIYVGSRNLADAEAIAARAEDSAGPYCLLAPSLSRASVRSRRRDRPRPTRRIRSTTRSV